MAPRELLSRIVLLASSLLATCPLIVADEVHPNLLIITVDDMSADSLGAYGCELDETSPNIDEFARESLRFQHAHVQVGNCMPGRNIMWSGLFAHVNGVEGFRQNKDADYPVLCDLMKAAGYFTAIRGKVAHSTPYTPYAWDAVLDTAPDGTRWHQKDPEGYGASARQGIKLAKESGKPYCLMINISDPHKPFYGQGRRGADIDDPHVPSRVFTADEVPVPGFLPKDDVIRKELAHYYSSVRRADDCFAEIMKALEESGEPDNTFVMFLSDHGMPLPFAKTQLYHHSTRTPLMIRWPGVTQAGASDELHFVSAIDFLPTLLDVVHHEHPDPETLQGRSFAPLLRGETQQGREFVIKQYNENAGGNRHPMRGIQTDRFLYLYNPWSNGERKFATATTGTQSYRQMVKRAKSEPEIALRLNLFDHRVVEELYDVENDPDCRHNLVHSDKYQSTLAKLREQLAESLSRIDDPVAPLVADIDNEQLRQRYMRQQDQLTRRAKQRRQRAKASTSQAEPRRKLNALTWKTPDRVQAGSQAAIEITYRIPADLGQQKLHVTLKTAAGKSDGGSPNTQSQRVHREVLTVEGQGTKTVQFNLAKSLDGEDVQFAVFLGEDFKSHLQHLVSRAVTVE